MRFCKYCGTEISEADRICPVCNKEINPSKNSRESPKQEMENAAVISVSGPSLTADSTPDAKPDSTPGASPENVQNKMLKSGKDISPNRSNVPLPVAAAVSVVLIASLILIVLAGRCKAEGCSNSKASGSDYCYYHKCDVPGCREEKLSYSNFCYEHYSMYDDDDHEGNQVYSWELKISNVKVYSEHSYTYVEGTLTNNSDTTVKYVKIKGAFKSVPGTVIDTDWTYAVGDEGLAPGETCKWKMMVTKDPAIKFCDVTIFDYD